MRKLIGIAVLVIGWILLGLIGSGNILSGWNFGKDAVEMEQHLSSSAQAAVSETTYDLETSVSGRDIQVSGIVANDIEKAAVIANLDSIRGRRVVVDNLSLIEIAKPYVFRGSKNADNFLFSGNAPTNKVLQGIVDPTVSTLSLAGGMPDEQWPDFVKTGVEGISILSDGAFEISDRKITVSGLAKSFDEVDTVKDVFANLPEGYSAEVNLTVAPTVPYVFTGTKNGAAENYSGYIPNEQSRGVFAGLIGDSTNDLKLAAGMPDDKWPSVVGVGIKALQRLNTGTLKIVDKRVEVSGSVNTPDAIRNIENSFAVMPEGYTSNVNLTALDDGAPASLNFDWDAVKGGAINGKGPEGVALDDLTSALKLPALTGIFREGKVEGKDHILAQFAGIGGALPMFEAVSASITANTTNIKATLLPGGDMDLAESTLTEALGDNAKIDILRSPSEPNEGDERVNSDTGKNEVYMNGFWRVVPETVVEAPAKPETQTEAEPEVAVEAEVEITSYDRCTTQTSAFMENTSITYETASATLTSDSQSSLAKFADLIRDCVNSDRLQIEIGGHTDSQGSEEFNRKLSQQRAESVRAALVGLGIDQAAVTAKGFGEAEPIASNDTSEGRALNRRTTFTWIEE